MPPPRKITTTGGNEQQFRSDCAMVLLGKNKKVSVIR
jgi:hypothetical protein